MQPEVSQVHGIGVTERPMPERVLHDVSGGAIDHVTYVYGRPDRVSYRSSGAAFGIDPADLVGRRRKANWLATPSRRSASRAVRHRALVVEVRLGGGIQHLAATDLPLDGGRVRTCDSLVASPSAIKARSRSKT